MPSVHAILLNYKRRHNIVPIVRACLVVDGIESIHVIDQADPGQRLELLPVSPRIVPRRARNIGAGRRLSYAADLSCDLVIAIDDDLFLTAAQITELIRRSLEDPSRVHGIWGQLILDADGGVRTSTAIRNEDRAVDILNRVYLFTPGHARNALKIADSIGLKPDRLGPVDDILLSFGGARRPMCHDVGTIYECETSNQPGIAVWKQADFEKSRIDMLETLRATGRAWDEDGGHAPSAVVPPVADARDNKLVTVRSGHPQTAPKLRN